MAPAGGNGHIKNKQFNADGDDNRPQDAPRDQAPDQNRFAKLRFIVLAVKLIKYTIQRSVLVLSTVQ